MRRNYTYDAFGKLEGRAGYTENSYQFAGEQFDKNLDQYYLRQRYYSSGTGRFESRDNFEGSLFQPSSLHKFLYANANPISFVDPSGNVSISDLILYGVVLTILEEVFAPYAALTPTHSRDVKANDPTAMRLALGLATGFASNGFIPGILGIISGGPEGFSVLRAVGGITQRWGARSGRLLGGCDTCASELATYLKGQGIAGKIVEIRTTSTARVSGNIFSNTTGETIATNGYHRGTVVVVDGVETVYDTVHPQGIPLQQWIDDFETPGQFQLFNGRIYQEIETWTGN